MDTAGAQAPATLQLHHHPDSHEYSALHQQPQSQQQLQPQLDAAVAYPPLDGSQSQPDAAQAHPSNQFLEPEHAVAGRFTEEWDASQRGSSILDHHGATADMQRSASVNSYAAGDDQSLSLRNNTLRKKSSMRRTASSAGRSSSRRSTRAGSVRSLALHSATDPDEAHSAFYCPVPTSGTPTTILAERFHSKSTTLFSTQ